MYLASIKIKNFRGIKATEFYLHQHCILLGSNNSGKSTIMDAIGYLLGRDKMIKSLGDYDFFGGKPLPQERITISGLLTGFGSNEPRDFPDWFNTLNGGVPIWYSDELNDTHEGDFKDGYNLSVQIAFCARFDEEDLEYESVRYFSDADTDPFEDNTIVRLNSKQLREIGFFLVPSKRNWERTISFGSELFKKVIKFQNAIPGKTVSKTRDTLRGITDRIEHEPLKTIVGRINTELAGFMNSSTSGLNFIPTTGDIEGVLQSLTPHLAGNGSTNIPLGNHGSGIISLQTLLLLLEFGKYRNQNDANFLLGVEEPELHLQPGLHRRLVSRIRGLSNQSIITTHSPQIASYYKPSEINILRNVNGDLKVVPLLKADEEMPEKNSVMRLFTIYRAEICEALMNRRVFLPEGMTEYLWIKSLISAVITAEGWDFYKGECSSSGNVGILPTQDASVEKTYVVFSELIEELVPIVDGDSAGDNYVKTLIALESPPKLILQLPVAWNLERILTWIISGDEDAIPDQLLQYVENFDSTNTSLFALLTKYKAKWDSHERVIEYLVTQQESVKRAKIFIDSLCDFELNVANENENWIEEKSTSTSSSRVFRFNPK